MPIRGARQPGDRHSRDRRTPGWSGSHSLRDFLRNRSEAEENTTKAKNAAEDAIGKAKEVIGDVTNNDELAAEGKKDQGSPG